jgi:hypothetical protein
MNFALVVALERAGRYGMGMVKKLLLLAIVVGIGFLAAKKLRAA